MEFDDQDSHEFEQGGAGAGLTYPVQASSLRKNGHVVIEKRLCTISELSTAHTHEHGKTVDLVGLDIFTGKNSNFKVAATDSMEVPYIK